MFSAQGFKFFSFAIPMLLLLRETLVTEREENVSKWVFALKMFTDSSGAIGLNSTASSV
jgi:hypothetical protein